MFGFGNKKLKGKRVAILVANGFEQVELEKPKDALEAQGAEVVIISPEKNKVRGWKMTDWGDKFKVDLALNDADPDLFSALMLPGGIINPDMLRLNKRAITLIREFYESGKPIAAICHAPIMLLESKLVSGLRMTSYPSIKTDLKNAGAIWVDEEVVTDQGIITSRTPADLPAFNKKMIEEIREGIHQRGMSARDFSSGMSGMGMTEIPATEG